jgi:hypothetical protein
MSSALGVMPPPLPHRLESSSATFIKKTHHFLCFGRALLGDLTGVLYTIQNQKYIDIRYRYHNHDTMAVALHSSRSPHAPAIKLISPIKLCGTPIPFSELQCRHSGAHARLLTKLFRQARSSCLCASSPSCSPGPVPTPRDFCAPRFVAN